MYLINLRGLIMKKTQLLMTLATTSILLLTGCNSDNKENQKVKTESEKVTTEEKLTPEKEFEKKLIGEWVSPDAMTIYEFIKNGQMTIQTDSTSKELATYEVTGFEDNYAIVELTQNNRIEVLYIDLVSDGQFVKTRFPGSSSELNFFKTDENSTD